MDCVNGAGTPSQCATSWADGIASLNGAEPKAREASLGYAEYYVGLLRKNGGTSADCRAQ
jgi:hypothetical protein